jgi:hypothetical protein
MEKRIIRENKYFLLRKKAEYLDHDYLGVNDHIVFRTTSWLDAITTAHFWPVNTH